jgi:hypothetical protein
MAAARSHRRDPDCSTRGYANTFLALDLPDRPVAVNWTAEAGCHAIDIPGQTAAELAEEIARPWNAPLPIDMAILIRR